MRLNPLATLAIVSAIMCACFVGLWAWSDFHREELAVIERHKWLIASGFGQLELGRMSQCDDLVTLPTRTSWHHEAGSERPYADNIRYEVRQGGANILNGAGRGGFGFQAVYIGHSAISIDGHSLAVSAKSGLAEHGTVIQIPFWSVVILFASAPVLWLLLLVRELRVNHATDRGRCVECGYDLRATPIRCPECGTRHQRAGG